MISRKRLEEQLKRINCHYKGWGRSEFQELCNILMPDEEIEECVNGYYEAGFALLVATKDRVLLVDKKPLGYLTVEDMRFDMINELDLHHRLMGAQIKISAGNKTLHFTSLNQARLRRLLNYVQARMTQIKKDQAEHQQTQKQHLEEMNEQLRLYLMAAHKQQYLDQAMAIQGGGPAPLVFDNPYLQLAPAAAMNQFAPASGTGAPNISQPKTPFEHAAAAAFDGTQAVNLTAPQQQPVPKDESSSSLTPQQVGLAAVRRVVPVITAYTRLPLMNRRHLSNTRSDISENIVSSSPVTQA